MEVSMNDNFSLENEKGIISNELIPIDVKDKDFNIIMSIYKEALNQVYNDLTEIQNQLKNLYGYDIINNISTRIKTLDSIINKMKKKNYKINYKNLINNINDIAGIRVICPLKDNIYTVKNIIENMDNIKILEEKDFISKPKKSGYSGYHIIVETPVNILNNTFLVKVEIQIRTMAMDFWSTNEHKIKYKSNKKISKFDSKKLVYYAKILNILDNKIMELYKKQNYRTT